MNRVERMIREDFLELLKTKSFYDVSVKEILEKNNISRTSFYKYFEDKYDLLDTIQKESIEGFDTYLRRMVQEIPDLSVINGIPADQRIYTGIFKYVDETYAPLTALFGPNSDGMFFGRVMEYVRTTLMIFMEAGFLSEQYSKDQWDYINSFLAYGYLGIVVKWLNMGPNRKSAEEMGEMLAGIVTNYFSGRPTE